MHMLIVSVYFKHVKSHVISYSILTKKTTPKIIFCYFSKKIYGKLVKDSHNV